MINGVRFKVCGITNLVDADLADGCGADYLGFIFYPQSPRYLPVESFKAMAHRLPPRKKVAVSVSPSTPELKQFVAAGFDAYQIHYPSETGQAVIDEWASVVGAEKLWLAPRLQPQDEITSAALAIGKTFLWDTYQPQAYGGSGKTGDWRKFKRYKEAHPEKLWILAGGLNPENIGSAVLETGARFVDVNSGVETTPGIKSEDKLRRLVLGLHEATKRDNPAN